MLFLLVLWMIHYDTASLMACSSLTCPTIFEQNHIHPNLGSLDEDLPSKLVGINYTTGCVCREVPNVYTLCCNLQGLTLRCVEFPKKLKPVTPSLLLKATFIKEILYGDFDNVAHLEMLTLDGNQKLHRIEPYVFEKMKNLTTLCFIFNPSLTYLDPNTFEGLVNLKELRLLKNGFQDLKMLSITLRPLIIPQLFKLNLKDNLFRNISEDDFEPMTGSTLEVLNMVLCSIEHIHPKALKPLKNLSALRIGENRFDQVTLLDLIKETLASGIDLKVLDIHSSGIRTVMPRALSHQIAKSNITSLFLARNQFTTLDNKTFPVKMPNLTLLDVSDVSAQNIGEDAFTNLPNLKRLILTKNLLSYFPSSLDLPNLTCLDLDKNADSYGWEFFLTKSRFSRMKLEYLNLQFTRLNYLTRTDFGYMPHLRSLNLKNCSIFKTDDGPFNGLTNLNCLNLENNRFYSTWMISYFDLFEGLEDLEELLLGGNGIITLAVRNMYLLKNLKRIKRLGLDRNKLQTITREDFAPLKHLEVLDISNNYILTWEDRIFFNHNLREFYGAVNKIVYFSDAMLEDFQNLTKLEVSYNSFVCTCRFKFDITKIAEAKKLLTRMRDSEIFCVQPTNTTLADFFLSIVENTLMCDEFNIFVLIIPSVVLLVIGTIIGALSYLYRWHIRYWAFLVRLYLTRKGRIRRTIPKRYTNHEFDAFVSYCNHDRNFVIRLVRMLENNEPYLKLCVYERDFQVGSLISESVLDHINKSRKTLLIVSDSYAKSYWCNWETQIAEHHRLFIEGDEYIDESIVLIKLGSINETQLNPTLKYLLKTRIYLQWQSDIEEQHVFWKKLRQFLSTSNNVIAQNSYM